MFRYPRQQATTDRSAERPAVVNAARPAVRRNHPVDSTVDRPVTIRVYGEPQKHFAYSLDHANAQNLHT